MLLPDCLDTHLTKGGLVRAIQAQHPCQGVGAPVIRLGTSLSKSAGFVYVEH